VDDWWTCPRPGFWRLMLAIGFELELRKPNEPGNLACEGRGLQLDELVGPLETWASPHQRLTLGPLQAPG
jgi:hypothetical protein